MISKLLIFMLKTKNSCTSLKLDEAFSEIEEELENKLWELYDKMHDKKILNC